MLTIRLAKQAEQALSPGAQLDLNAQQPFSLKKVSEKQAGALPLISSPKNITNQPDSANEKDDLALPKFPRNQEVTGVHIMGYKVMRRTGEKVHFCTQCNLPIAIYGRLEPCLHAFCFTCAKGQERCYLCDAEISRKNRVDGSECLYICGAPGCLVSFFSRAEFAAHMRSLHADLCPTLLPRIKLEPMVASKNAPQGPSLKRPWTGDSSRMPRQDPNSAAAPSSGTVPSNGPEASAGGGGPVAARPSSSQQQRAPNQEPFEDPPRGGQPPQPHHPQGHPGPFPNPRMHANQGPPDFHQGPMGPMGMQGPGGPPGVAPREMGPMGPMDGRGPGPMGPHWGDFGPMGGPPPFMEPPPSYRDMQYNGPRGNFRPGGPDESGYGWGGGNQNFGPGPGYGGGWRPPQ